MTLVWECVRAELEDRVSGVEAVWALLWHAQGGVLALALVEPLDRDLRLTEAGQVMALALDALEIVRPEVRSLCLPGEPGQVPLDDISGYRAGIGILLDAVLDEVARMLREESAELPLEDLAALASVATLTGQARELVTSHLR